MKNKAVRIIVVFVWIAFVTVSAQSGIQKAVASLADKAFKETDIKKIRTVFLQEIPALSSPLERKEAFAILAEYEEQLCFYADAAEQYRNASMLASGEESVLFLLDACRCSVLNNAVPQAAHDIAMLRNRAGTSLASSDCTVLAYDAWIRIQVSIETSDDALFARALADIRSYVVRNEFAALHPALLFTLWWCTDDAVAKNTLRKRFPASIETAVIENRADIVPSVFWYLMPRSDIPKQINAGVDSKSENVPLARPSAAVKSSADNDRTARIHYLQVGFFKTEDYAQSLIADLRKKGFIPELRKDIRASGTVYFVVLVKENAEGTLALQLKDAGYECFPVFE